MKAKNVEQKCYMCDATGNTKEHAPPFAFFPNGLRYNLVTVLSCAQHNHNNSKDVEYVRNIIVSGLDTNAIARKWFQDKALKSLKRSSKLAQRTFRDITPIKAHGRETVIVEIEMPRFDSIMKAIAFALYYKDFGKTYPRDWIVFSPTLVSTDVIVRGVPDFYAPLRYLFSQLPFNEMITTQPQVFKYAVHQENEADVFYRFEFYEGFIVHVVRFPK